MEGIILYHGQKVGETQKYPQKCFIINKSSCFGRLFWLGEQDECCIVHMYIIIIIYLFAKRGF